MGKSTLFNALAGRRIAIVEPTAGVTRDRLSQVVALGERYVEILDTGGIGVVDSDELEEDIERQIDVAIARADVVVFLLDVRDGVTPLDERVAEKLRALDVPKVIAANKADTRNFDAGAADFYRLGFEEVLPVSAKGRRGLDELLEKIHDLLPPEEEDMKAPAEPDLKIAVVGRRNVGKSTLLNAMAEEERVIVSEVPGTTRDSVDIRFEKDGRTFLVIDTAGMRKRTKFANAIEFFSQQRAEAAVRRADVVFLVLDVTSTISNLDKKLAGLVADEKKPCIIVANKWDLAKDKIVTGEFADYVTKRLPWLIYAPVVTVTATESKNVVSLLDTARALFKQAGRRVSTGLLNRVVDKLRTGRTHSKSGKRPRIFYATQVGVYPPTIVVFVNDPDAFSAPYQRRIENLLRDELEYPEIPIRVILRQREGRRK